MKKRVWLKILIPVLITVLILLFVQQLLMPKYMTETKEGAMISEYYEKDNHGNNDVVFVGDCEVYENFSPVLYGTNMVSLLISEEVPSS